MKKLFLTIFAMIMIYPLCLFFAISVKDLDEINRLSLFCRYPTFRHYIRLLLYTPGFYVTFWNTMKITVLSLLLQLITAIPAAWGFAGFSFRGKNILFSLYVLLMLVPFQVIMLSRYLVLEGLQLMNTQWTLILPSAFATLPVFLIYHSFLSIPKECIQAAKMDGAGEWDIFCYISLPLGKQGILAAIVLTFPEYWNMLEEPLIYIRKKTLWPLSLFFARSDMGERGLLAAAGVISLLPLLFLFFFGEEELERGIAEAGLQKRGGIK